ncbi:MAG: hypothetical protein HZB26_15720 [Candidatus Hydrogenedentes bacterium]|nr:hypothetical protein [Candidatus Hydrogenedentota bacterium]
MAGLSSVGSVGAVLSQAQFQAAVQTRAPKEQRTSADGMGAAALRLIQSSLVMDQALQRGLDVKA